jgi:hypothetical protein
VRKITKIEAKEIIEKLVNSRKVSEKDIKKSLKNNERICVNCGCSDLRACQHECCWWTDEDLNSEFGICSNCEDVLEDWE